MHGDGKICEHFAKVPPEVIQVLKVPSSCKNPGRRSRSKSRSPRPGKKRSKSKSPPQRPEKSPSKSESPPRNRGRSATRESQSSNDSERSRSPTPAPFERLPLRPAPKKPAPKTYSQADNDRVVEEIKSRLW